MHATANFLAIDLGASSGRVCLGRWSGERITLEEIHRFPNGPVEIQGHLHWDVLRLWAEIKTGISSYVHQYKPPIESIGVDTWGVDFALLDHRGYLLGNPYHYRDLRTEGAMEFAFERMPRWQIFEQTGNQFIQFNTLFQLLSMSRNKDPQLEMADTMLMMPDLFHYWLTGQKVSEFTIATTSQMYDVRQKCWAKEVLQGLEIPSRFLPTVVPPGTILGRLNRAVIDETGLRQPAKIVTPASHDTSSAIAAIPDLDSRSVYISSGTWSLLGVEISKPIINDQVLALNFTNEGGINNKTNLQKILTGLWLLQESHRQWQRKGMDYGWKELLGLSEQAEPFRSLVDPDAPIFLNPEDMLSAIQSFCQQTDQPQPESVGAIVRCCLESLALNYRTVVEDLENLLGDTIDIIRIVGGGSQNDLLSQFTADACQRRVMAGPVEATAIGNLLLQVIATGHLPDIQTGRAIVAASFEQKEFEPEKADMWEEAYSRFKKLKGQKER